MFPLYGPSPVRITLSPLQYCAYDLSRQQCTNRSDIYFLSKPFLMSFRLVIPSMFLSIYLYLFYLLGKQRKGELICCFIHCRIWPGPILEPVIQPCCAVWVAGPRSGACSPLLQCQISQEAGLEHVVDLNTKISIWNAGILQGFEGCASSVARLKSAPASLMSQWGIAEGALLELAIPREGRVSTGPPDCFLLCDAVAKGKWCPSADWNFPYVIRDRHPQE